mgnify:CR=1 FL=1
MPLTDGDHSTACAVEILVSLVAAEGYTLLQKKFKNLCNRCCDPDSFPLKSEHFHSSRKCIMFILKSALRAPIPHAIHWVARALCFAGFGD